MDILQQIIHVLLLVVGVVASLHIEIFQLLEIFFLHENLLQCWRILSWTEPATAVTKFVLDILNPFLTLLRHLQHLEDSNFTIFTLVHQLEAAE